MALTDAYSLPYGISLSSAAASAGAWTISSQCTVYSDGLNNINADDGYLYICWYSSYRMFQVQHRERSRYAPSYAGYTGAETEIWTEWSAWTGSDSTAASISKSGNFNTLASGWKPPYILTAGTHDAYERQYRVRVFDGENWSAWVEETFRLRYLPTITFNTVTFNSDGSVSIALTTNWQREAVFRLGEVYANNGFMRSALKGKNDDSFPVSNSAASFTIPAGVFPSAGTWYIPQAYIRAENSYRRFDRTRTIAPVSGEIPGITEPTVTFADSDTETTVTVSHASATGITGRVEWSDRYGIKHVEMLDFAHDTNWTASFAAPPFGIAVDYKVSVVTANGWKMFTFPHTVTGHDNVWTDGAETIRMRYKESPPTQNTDTKAEIVELANGDSVSRHGNAKAKTFNIVAAIINPSLAGQGSPWIADAERFSEHHDWWYRDPFGERVRVAITAFGVNEEWADKVYTVSISMREVS